MQSFTKLKIYPLNGKFIAKINYQSLDVSKSRAQMETVIILDRSGSMDVSVARIVNEIIPEFLEKLNYTTNEMIHLITFEANMEYWHMRVGEFANADIQCAGNTNMKSAVTKFNELFHNFNQSGVTSVRLLTISDGQIHDQAETRYVGEAVASFAKSTGILVNSHAIRWESPSADTTALCSLLQLNNVRPPKLLDISIAQIDDEISTLWAELFMDDRLCMIGTISQDKSIFLKFAWDLEASNKINLLPGENIFWLKEIPSNVTVDGNSVQIEVSKTLSYYELLSMLVENLDLIANNMATLKVVNSNECKATIQRILEYFRNMEASIPQSNKGSSSVNKKFSEILTEIATNDEVDNMNPTEKADFLRAIQKSIADEVAQQKALADEEARKAKQLKEEIARKAAHAEAQKRKEIEEKNAAQEAKMRSQREEEKTAQIIADAEAQKRTEKANIEAKMRREIEEEIARSIADAKANMQKEMDEKFASKMAALKATIRNEMEEKIKQQIHLMGSKNEKSSTEKEIEDEIARQINLTKADKSRKLKDQFARFLSLADENKSREVEVEIARLIVLMETKSKEHQNETMQQRIQEEDEKFRKFKDEIMKLIALMETMQSKDMDDEITLQYILKEQKFKDEIVSRFASMQAKRLKERKVEFARQRAFEEFAKQTEIDDEIRNNSLARKMSPWRQCAFCNQKISTDLESEIELLKLKFNSFTNGLF